MTCKHKTPCVRRADMELFRRTIIYCKIPKTSSSRWTRFSLYKARTHKRTSLRISGKLRVILSTSSDQTPSISRHLQIRSIWSTSRATRSSEKIRYQKIKHTETASPLPSSSAQATRSLVKTIFQSWLAINSTKGTHQKSALPKFETEATSKPRATITTYQFMRWALHWCSTSTTKFLRRTAPCRALEIRIFLRPTAFKDTQNWRDSTIP